MFARASLALTIKLRVRFDAAWPSGTDQLDLLYPVSPNDPLPVLAAGTSTLTLAVSRHRLGVCSTRLRRTSLSSSPAVRITLGRMGADGIQSHRLG